MKSHRFRLLSVFLTIAVLLVSLQIYAVPGNQTNGSPTEPEDRLPYPYRMPEEEPNLYTLVYRIDDELCSMEVYDTPVKFEDKDGKVKDILPEIEETDTGFRTKQSSIVASFPSDISEGISLSYKNLSICEKPQFDAEQGTLSPNGTKLTYSVSDNTFLEYSLTYTGYKENIVVSEYTGQTDYSFVYYTNGLAIESTDGTVLFSDEDGKAVAYLGEIIVFTADEKNNFFGDLEIEEITFREEYRVTVVLDGERLASEQTAYPITIDPEINIIYEESGANALEDATINSLSGTSGSATSLHVGPRNTYGISRILMRFPGLDLSPVSYPDQIVSANLRVRDLMCYGTHLTVNCHVFNPVWGESTVSWANTSPNNYNSAVLDSHEIYYNNGNYVAEGYTHSNVYHFDVTDAVRSWVTNYTGKYSGIILKATDAFENSGTKFAVTLGSYERASNKPKLLITYSCPEDGQYYIVSADYGKYLHSGGSVDATSGTIAALGNTIRFELKGTANGKYSIRPLNQTNKYIGRTDGTSLGLVTCADPDSIPDECLWTLSGNKIRCTVGGTTYYLKAIGAIVYLTSDSSAIGIDWYRAKTDYYGNTSAFPKRELESDFSVANLTLQVGETKTPVINKSPSNALWAGADMFTCSIISASPANCITVNTSSNSIKANHAGIASLLMTHKVTGLSSTLSVEVNSLLIYRTRNRETLGFLNSDENEDVTVITQEDFLFSDLSASDIVNSDTQISPSDLFSNVITEDQYTVSYRVNNIIKPFFHGQVSNDVTFCDILDEMIDSFANGTVDYYSNDDLTSAVENHANTSFFVSNANVAICNCISNCQGAIENLEYDEGLWVQPTLREQHPVVAALLVANNGKKLTMPSYGFDNGEPGLSLAINGFEGMKIEISSYSLSGNSYSAVLQFTFYDHFGLDSGDLSIPTHGICCNIIPAFRQWYLMQHWQDLDCTVHPKPFVTVVSFSVPITGTLS